MRIVGLWTHTQDSDALIPVILDLLELAHYRTDVKGLAS